jgi:hypothetical protein
MNYGSLAYGASALAGDVNALQTFFPYGPRLAGDYEAQLELNTVEDWYSVFIRGHDNDGETPQLQTVTGDALYAQAVVGAHKFITVRVTVFNSQFFSITGRAGD